MKIIRCVPLPSDTFDIDIHPDSAMILPGRPLFMPEFGSSWSAVTYIAVRISRLGKNIAAKFASRYYDAVSLALLVVPDCDETDTIPHGLLSAMDSTVVHGEWFPADTIKSDFIICHGETSAEITPMDSAIDNIISRISSYTTLKMGDLVMFPLDFPPIHLSEKSTVNLSLNSSAALTLKVV